MILQKINRMGEISNLTNATLSITFTMLEFYMLLYPLSVRLLELQMYTSVDISTTNDDRGKL